MNASNCILWIHFNCFPHSHFNASITDKVFYLRSFHRYWFSVFIWALAMLKTDSAERTLRINIFMKKNHDILLGNGLGSNLTSKKKILTFLLMGGRVRVRNSPKKQKSWHFLSFFFQIVADVIKLFGHATKLVTKILFSFSDCPLNEHFPTLLLQIETMSWFFFLRSDIRTQTISHKNVMIYDKKKRDFFSCDIWVKQ
jgi:hypothetical protein